jgi:CAAX protease family protein
LSSPDNPQFEPQAPSNQEAPAPIEPALSTSAPYLSAALPLPVAGPTPVENPVWNGWDVLLVIALAIVTILVSQLAILFGAKYFLYRRASLADLAQRPILLLVSQFVIDGAVALFLFLLVEGKYHVGFWKAIRWNWPRAAWKLLLIGAVMLLGLSMLESFLPMPKETPFEKLFMRPRDAYLLAVIAVSVGPLVEELFFRGFFYPVLARRWGAGWGIFLTALPFAVMHMPQYGYAWGALLVILTVGVVCGIVRAVTRSVGASFLVHVGYNGTQMLIAVVATHGFRHIEKAVMCLR